MKSLLVGVVCLGVMGCTAQNGQGVAATPSQLITSMYAPTIVYQTPDGEFTTLTRTRHSVAIIAFVDAAGTNCDALSPVLTGLAQKYQLERLPISVVQVTLPTSRCPAGPGCIQLPDAARQNVIAICDRERTAWNQFAQPAVGTVYLIDASDQIVQLATLDKMDALLTMADQLGRRNRELRREEWQPVNMGS